MIRKILFLGIFICVQAAGLHAQCTPDTSLKTAGFSPLSLPAANVNVAYSEPISVLVFRDTSITIGSTKIAVKIDSIKATGMLGLPQGFDYTCLHPRCVFVWNEVRCVNIFGTTSQSGLFPILIPVVAYGKIAGTTPVTRPDTLRNFAIQVNGGSNKVVELKTNAVTIFPNPTNNSLTVIVPKTTTAKTLTIFDATGRVCGSYSIGDKKTLHIETLSLSNGTYMVSIGEYSSQFTVIH